MANIELSTNHDTANVNVENTYVDGVFGALLAVRVAMNQLHAEKAVAISEEDFKTLFDRAVHIHEEAYTRFMVEQLGELFSNASGLD